MDLFDNKSASVQVMTWHGIGYKSLPELGIQNQNRQFVILNSLAPGRFQLNFR